jgi:hypothetical protein
VTALPKVLLRCDVGDCNASALLNGPLGTTDAEAAGRGWTKDSGRDFCPDHSLI